MALVQKLTSSFLQELLMGYHNFSASGGDTFKIALYDETADLGPDTTDYTTDGEITGLGYIAGGSTLTNLAPTVSGRTAMADFADISWTGATFSARGALIYNTTAGVGTGTTNAVMVLDFGLVRTVSDGTFTVRFPQADVDNAIVRITGS